KPRFWNHARRKSGCLLCDPMDAGHTSSVHHQRLMDEGTVELSEVRARSTTFCCHFVEGVLICFL
ncbi:hypothetical protein AMECASPLE_034178, partial [Ameca splendens]